MKIIVQYEQNSLDEMDIEIQALQDTATKLINFGQNGRIDEKD